MKKVTNTTKIVASMILVTIVSLGYVHQKVLIYQMGLRLKENNFIHTKLVDRNRLFVYNVLNLRSPITLEKKLLAKRVELDVPHKWQVVEVRLPKKFFAKGVTKKGLFANLFNVSREAEASPNR